LTVFLTNVPHILIDPYNAHCVGNVQCSGSWRQDKYLFSAPAQDVCSEIEDVQHLPRTKTAWKMERKKIIFMGFLWVQYSALY
jgi:hypothetical protein